MKLISQMYINSTYHYVSDQWVELTSLYEPHIMSITPTRISCHDVYGGYARPKFGSRSFSPTLFDSGNDWPPPKQVEVRDQLIEDDAVDNSAAVTVFEGTLHLESYNEREVVYTVYRDDYQNVVSNVTYNDDLEGVFTTYCGASYLNLTLNTDGTTRAASTTVYWVRSGSYMLIEELSLIAAFHSHAFYIEDGTLYLIDMLTGDGTLSLDEFQYFPNSQYHAQQPISIYKTGDGTTGVSVNGTYKYGEERTISGCCVNTAPLMTTALGNIKTIMESDFYRFRIIPESGNLPKIGTVVTVTNESLLESTTVEFYISSYSIDPFNSEIIIEGYGAEV